MSLKIRLSRGGAKKRPFYRIVVADSRMPRDGRFIEKIGHYNPMLPKDSPERVVLEQERAEHWLKIGAKPSDRVARFLSAANMIELPERREQTKKNQPKAKAQERMREAEEKAKEAAEAKAPPAPLRRRLLQPGPRAEEAPAEEPAAEEAPAAEAPAEEAAAEEAPAEEAKEA